MPISRWINRTCAVLLVLAAAGFVMWLPDLIENYEAAPGYAWIGGTWVLIFAALATLCFSNGFALGRPSEIRMIANQAAILILAVLIVLAWEDTAAVLVLMLCALGPVTALAGLLANPRPRRAAPPIRNRG